MPIASMLCLTISVASLIVLIVVVRYPVFSLSVMLSMKYPLQFIVLYNIIFVAVPSSSLSSYILFVSIIMRDVKITLCVSCSICKTELGGSLSSLLSSSLFLCFLHFLNSPLLLSFLFLLFVHVML